MSGEISKEMEDLHQPLAPATCNGNDAMNPSAKAVPLLPVGWQELRLWALLVQQVLVQSITSLALGLWRGINKARTVSRRYHRKSKL